MTQSWNKGLAPLLGTALFTILLLVVSWKQGETLNGWAEHRHVGWNLLAAMGFLLSAGLALKTYAQLRNARLYALCFLLLPVGVVQFFHLSNPAPVERGAGGQQLSVSRIGELEGETDPTPRPRNFIGLPDSLSKRYPKLPTQLSVLFQQLHEYTLLFLPLLVIAASFLSFRLTSRRVRIASVLLVFGEIMLGAAVVLAFPKSLHELPTVVPLMLLLYALAAAMALAVWRSPAGVGGSVAGLLLYALPIGLASAGVSPIDVGLELKSLPSGSERIHVMVLPLVLTVLVGREWIVSMKHSTHTDALTQIFNKAYAENIVNQTGGQDLGALYSVALLDIDHFKKVNDTHGHGAGDVVLRQVALTIKQTIANRGLVCRTGGEEMTVFFPGLDVEGAKEICEEVREAVAELSIKTTDNNGKKVTLQVTVSMGVATNRDVASGDKLHPGVRNVVEAADRAVYAAKSSGRNRVIRD